MYDFSIASFLETYSTYYEENKLIMNYDTRCYFSVMCSLLNTCIFINEKGKEETKYAAKRIVYNKELL